MKTRLEILEEHHDQALKKSLETEINLRTVKKKSIILQPGDAHVQIQKEISKYEKIIKAYKEIIDTIEILIKEEDEK